MIYGHMPKIAGYILHLGKTEEYVQANHNSNAATGIAIFAQAAHYAIEHPDEKVLVEFVAEEAA